MPFYNSDLEAKNDGCKKVKTLLEDLNLQCAGDESISYSYTNGTLQLTVSAFRKNRNEITQQLDVWLKSNGLSSQQIKGVGAASALNPDGATAITYTFFDDDLAFLDKKRSDRNKAKLDRQKDKRELDEMKAILNAVYSNPSKSQTVAEITKIPKSDKYLEDRLLIGWTLTPDSFKKDFPDYTFGSAIITVAQYNTIIIPKSNTQKSTMLPSMERKETDDNIPDDLRYSVVKSLEEETSRLQEVYGFTQDGKRDLTKKNHMKYNNETLKIVTDRMTKINDLCKELALDYQGFDAAQPKKITRVELTEKLKTLKSQMKSTGYFHSNTVRDGFFARHGFFSVTGSTNIDKIINRVTNKPGILESFKKMLGL